MTPRYIITPVRVIISLLIALAPAAGAEKSIDTDNISTPLR